MDILNYKLDTTKELLTSRIGLLATAHTINTLRDFCITHNYPP